MSDGTTVVGTYNYNGLNDRVKKVTASETRLFYFNRGWRCLEERVGSTVDATYVWGTRYFDDLIYRDTSETRLYCLADPNWNVVALANTSGTVLERMAYSAFGKVNWLDATFANKVASGYGWTRTFTGQVLDNETGLMLYRNRFYHSTLGRFVTRDPIGYDGEDENLYRYVGNASSVKVDPDGLVVPVVPIVVGASCIACVSAAGYMFDAAHDICKNSDSYFDYSTCFLKAVGEMESSLDWYSWSVINAACVCCGGGLAGASKKFVVKYGKRYLEEQAKKKGDKMPPPQKPFRPKGEELEPRVPDQS